MALYLNESGRSAPYHPLLSIALIKAGANTGFRLHGDPTAKFKTTLEAAEGKGHKLVARYIRIFGTPQP
jgi:hypothetical protein